MNLYQDEILQHFKNSTVRGRLENADYEMCSVNLSCGDELTIFLSIFENRVQDAKFEGSGCAISQAACSMLLEDLIGRSIQELGGYGEDDILSMLGLPIGLNRRKCALLCLDVINKIYAQSQKSKN